jgi:hypothetical protein
MAALVAQAQDRRVSGTTHVSAEVRRAAAGSLGDFARALAQAGVAAGMVGYLDPGATGPRMQVAVGSVSMRSVLDAFRQNHLGYDAQIGGGIVAIRAEQPTICGITLGAAVKRSQFTGSPAEAVDRLVLDAKPALTPGGIVGNLSAQARATENARRRLPFSWAPNSTLETALNAIAARTGTVWLVQQERTSDGEICSLRLFDAEMTTVFGYDLK